MATDDTLSSLLWSLVEQFMFAMYVEPAYVGKKMRLDSKRLGSNTNASSVVENPSVSWRVSSTIVCRQGCTLAATAEMILSQAVRMDDQIRLAASFPAFFSCGAAVTNLYYAVVGRR